MERSHVHGMEFNIVTMAILPKIVYRFNAISVKIPPGFFAKNDKLTLKNLHRNARNPE